jgi:hypothetical protein
VTEVSEGAAGFVAGDDTDGDGVVTMTTWGGSR